MQCNVQPQASERQRPGRAFGPWKTGPSGQREKESRVQVGKSRLEHGHTVWVNTGGDVDSRLRPQTARADYFLVSRVNGLFLIPRKDSRVEPDFLRPANGV